MGTVKVVFCMDTEGPCDDPSNDELLSSWANVQIYAVSDKANNLRVRICKADGDQDRPN